MSADTRKPGWKTEPPPADMPVPVIGKPETAEPAKPAEANICDPAAFPELLARGRNQECIDAFNRLMETPRESITIVEQIAIGAAMIAKEDSDLTYPHEHFIAEVLNDFSEGTLTLETVEVELEDFRHNLAYAERIGESLAKNTGGK